MKHNKLLLMTICVIFYLYPLAVFADQNESRVEKQTEISPDPDQTENIGDILNLSKSSSFTVGCPTQSLFGQQFQAPTDTNWIASTSDNGAVGSILVFDNFVSTGSINQVCFWGINGYYTGDSWYVCYESPMAFQIRFYSDSNGGPDALVASYDVNCVGNQTGLIYRGAFELYQYYADLPVSVEMDKGWITIQGIDGNPECWFEW
ncbi:MAG: hypothetical protein GY865_05155, partial [candidate division Zixibacteria bacterium]|nr:hypothetical protein [candidate division Zixibacteria bacterium]